MQITSPDALRAWLKHRDMSYSELAELVGCTKQFIGQLATGQKTTCTPELAVRIEKVLVSPDDRRVPGFLPIFQERGPGVRKAARKPRRRQAKATSATVTPGVSDAVGDFSESVSA